MAGLAPAAPPCALPSRITAANAEAAPAEAGPSRAAPARSAPSACGADAGPSTSRAGLLRGATPSACAARPGWDPSLLAVAHMCTAAGAPKAPPTAGSWSGVTAAPAPSTATVAPRVSSASPWDPGSAGAARFPAAGTPEVSTSACSRDPGSAVAAPAGLPTGPAIPSSWDQVFPAAAPTPGTAARRFDRLGSEESVSAGCLLATGALPEPSHRAASGGHGSAPGTNSRKGLSMRPSTRSSVTDCDVSGAIPWAGFAPMGQPSRFSMIDGDARGEGENGLRRADVARRRAEESGPRLKFGSGSGLRARPGPPLPGQADATMPAAPPRRAVAAAATKAERVGRGLSEGVQGVFARRFR